MSQRTGGPRVRRATPSTEKTTGSGGAFVVAREKTNTVAVSPPGRLYFSRAPFVASASFAPLEGTIDVSHVPPRARSARTLDPDGGVDVPAGGTTLRMLGSEYHAVGRDPADYQPPVSVKMKLRALGFSLESEAPYGDAGIAAFQTLAGLEVSGTLDEPTMAAVDRAYDALSRRHT